MNYSLLPEIFALSVFIVGFRPLARRVGAHSNLWFLGWSLLAARLIANLLGASYFKVTTLFSEWLLDAVGLVFVLAAANVPKRRISNLLMLAISLPFLLLAAIDTHQIHSLIAGIAVCVLFLMPGIYLWIRPRQRTLSILYVSSAFAVFGLLMIPGVRYATHFADQSALAVIFLCAAYLYFTSATRNTRGVVAATIGFAAWGISYPFALVWAYLLPAFRLDRTILDLPIYFAVVGIMLTLLEEHVEHTERLAMHDPLTDLPNRRMFEARLIATMEEARINRTTVACLVIDVDNFKMINDTLGHSAGDQLLRALAVRLSWHMTPRDILARTGGDEFTALLAGVSDEHHLRFIAGAMMSAGSVPIIIDGKPVDLHISIGIALSPDHADDIDSLRRAADEAMYSAKRRGGSMLAFADED